MKYCYVCTCCISCIRTTLLLSKTWSDKEFLLLTRLNAITSQSTNPVQALENVEEKKVYIGILVWPLNFVTAKNISRNLHQWYLQWRNAGKIKYICENKIDCVWLMFLNQLKFFILPLSYNLRFYNTIEDTLKAFDDLKNKQKGVWSNFFDL